MASNFQEKYRSFMERRNGPDQMSRDALILGIVLLIIAVLLRDAARSVFTVLGLAAMVYAYWRMFSSKVSDRSRENTAYIAKRTEVLNKISAPFKKKGGSSAAGSSSSAKPSAFLQAAQKAAAQSTAQAQDKEHKYFFCPKCGQSVRVPKGAGKIRVTCPKCGEKFEKKA